MDPCTPAASSGSRDGSSTRGLLTMLPNSNNKLSNHHRRGHLAAGRRSPAATMLVFACQYCATQDAIVFCLLCGARLCVLCDAALHAAGAGLHHHTRARLCDTCAAAPSALRYGDGATLCAGCAACTGRGASGAGIVTQYTGCPRPTELLRLISVEAPPSDNLFYPWLDDKLRYDDDGGGEDEVVELEEGWDVEVETAKIERMLADCNNNNNNEQPSPPCQLQPQSFLPFSSSSTSSSVAMPLPEDARPPQPDASSAIAKKREDRERAKLRYYDKKKNRRFCKQIMYASRKARADTRKRVKGRFAKASSSSHDPQNDDMTPIHEAESIY